MVLRRLGEATSRIEKDTFLPKVGKDCLAPDQFLRD